MQVSWYCSSRRPLLSDRVTSDRHIYPMGAGHGPSPFLVEGFSTNREGKESVFIVVLSWVRGKVERDVRLLDINFEILFKTKDNFSFGVKNQKFV